MLRIEVSEAGRPALPAIDVEDPTFVIGSSPAARIRLPAAVARGEHVMIDRGTWRTADGSGAIGDGHTFEIASYRVRVAPAPAGSVATPPQRTESLARELVRDLLGAAGAPSLVVERGPHARAKRTLAPPESSLVIGRGDEAHWIFDDPDLSKRHVEIRRTWDGVRAVDLDSKNGTRLDTLPLRDSELRDGMVLELGKLALRYHDPAERQLGSSPHAAITTAPEATPPGRTAAPAVRGARRTFALALALAILALAGIVVVALR